MITRILQINGHAIKNRGVEKYLLDVYLHIDKSKYQFDFLTPLICENDEFRSKVQKNGGKIYEMHGKDHKIYNKFSCVKIWKFLKTNKYEIVHIHTGNVLLMSLYAAAAKLAGVKRVLVHAHNSADMRTGNTKKTLKNRVAEVIMGFSCDGYFACSKMAAQYMFSKKVFREGKYRILPNGIDVTRYRYNSHVREKIRNELHISQAGQLVLGNVGALVYQKNQIFLIEMMRHLCDCEEYKNAKMLLVGEGGMKCQLEDLAKKVGLSSNIIFYGTTDKVEEILSAIDILVMPSRYEGFPVVGVEAQAAGLESLLSDKITEEIKLTDTVSFLPIYAGTEEIWCSAIKARRTITDVERWQINDKMKRGPYEISNSVKLFEEIYAEKVGTSKCH